MKKDKGCLAASIIIFIGLLILGYALFPNDKEIYIKFFVYLDNQTTAVLVGFLGLFFGYFIWKKQHNRGLADKYFAEYLDSVYRFVAIKKEEADIRKGLNRRFWELKKQNKNEDDDEIFLEINKQLSKLNGQEIQNDGLMQGRRILLKKLNYEWQKPNEIKNDFSKKYKVFSKKPVTGEDALIPGVYEEAVNCINISIDDVIAKLKDIN